jgi:putative hemolysin
MFMEDKKTVNAPQIIDIKDIIKSKTSKEIPLFLINLIKKIIHQDEINLILTQHKDKTGVEFMSAALADFQIKTSIVGLENIPKNQRLIFASNHPLGALEALALGKHLGRFFDGNVNFITNELLAHLNPLKEIFTSVKVGEKHQSKTSIETLDNIFRSDRQIFMFPSGVVSRKIKNIVQDPEWKKMFVSKARQYQRDVVPVFCSGRNSNFFLNFSKFRKFLGIKTNIELMFLPNEMFKNKNSEIHITVGKPINYRTFTTEKSDFEWANTVREMVYNL